MCVLDQRTGFVVTLLSLSSYSYANPAQLLATSTVEESLRMERCSTSVRCLTGMENICTLVLRGMKSMCLSLPQCQGHACKSLMAAKWNTPLSEQACSASRRRGEARWETENPASATRTTATVRPD